MAPVKRDNLLPQNSTAFEDAQSETSARLLDAPTRVIREARVGGTAPKQLLQHLAWERSVHHPTDDEALMRARIETSFADHLSYGTPNALEREILEDTGVAIRVVEFFEDPQLEWPDFALDAEFELGDAPPDISGVIGSALRRKNVRDWPKKVRVRPRQPAGHFYTGAATFLGRTIRVLPEEALPPLPVFQTAAAARLILNIRVNPQ